MEGTTYHLSFNSDDAEYDAKSHAHKFALADTLNLVGSDAYIRLIDFQGLNSTENITSSNNEVFNGEKVLSIPTGFYTIDEIIYRIQVFLDPAFGKTMCPYTPTIAVKYNTSTLAVEFESEDPFSISDSDGRSGSLMEFLNFDTGDAALDDDNMYRLKSSRPIDLFKGRHNIHFVFNNLMMNNLIIQNDTFITLNRIAKIPINCRQGEYIHWTNHANVKSQLYDNSISELSVSMWNDYRLPMFDARTTFHFTIELTVVEHDDPYLAILNGLEAPKKNAVTFSPIEYPVVNTETGILKDARTLMEEQYNLRERTYATTHPLYKFKDKNISAEE